MNTKMNKIKKLTLKAFKFNQELRVIIMNSKILNQIIF